MKLSLFFTGAQESTANTPPLIARIYGNGGNPELPFRRTRLARNKTDHHAVFHSLDTNHVGPGQNGDQIQEGPGIFSKQAFSSLRSALRSRMVAGCSSIKREFYQIGRASCR